MKLTRLIILILFLPTACAATLSPLPASPTADSASQTGTTTLYISATMHIESAPDS